MKTEHSPTIEFQKNFSLNGRHFLYDCVDGEWNFIEEFYDGEMLIFAELLYEGREELSVSKLLTLLGY